MSTMNIRDILTDVPLLPANISVLLRGDHGIGKSSLVRQVTKTLRDQEPHMDYAVIDRRLSQMTPGDVIGLPKLDDDRTRYMPPDWYKTACEKPVVLFLDELNRAEVEVMQAAFQIVLDRELNGHRLHPQTRVFAAVNTRSQYNVQQIDPALLDRFFVIDVHFTVEEWIKWAKSEDIHPEMIDFIQYNPSFLQPPASHDPGSVQPSPRSVERAACVIRPLLLEGAANNGNYDFDRIRRVLGGFCGVEFAMAFLNHLRTEFKYTGEELLNDYENIRGKLKRHRVDVMVNACEKLAAYADTLETVNEKQAASLKMFIWDLEKDHRVTLWQRLARAGNARLPFIRSIHNSVAEAICDAFGVPMGPKGIGVLPAVAGAVQRADEETPAT